jgi:spermidine synthase
VSVFLSGSVVMVLEVLGTRLIAPIYGTSMHVWSALIAVTLLTLSVGYWLGGMLSDRRPHAATYFLLFEIAALLIVALPLVRAPVLIWTQAFGLRGGALAAAIVLLGAPLTVLGMVSPFAVRLGTAMVASVGTTAGRLYAISTAGSLIGTLLAGFYLIPSFRVRTLFLACAVTLVLPAVLFQVLHARRHLWVAAAVLVLVALTFLFPSRTAAEVIHVEDSHFGQIKIVDEGAFRTMLVNGTIQGRVVRATHQNVMAYAPTIAELAWRANPRGRWALLIGLGIGVLPPLFESFHVRSRAVEIDPAVVAAAVEFFGFDPNRVPVDVADGRQILKTIDRRFDYIVLDAFGGEVAPPHLLTREMMELVDARLGPGGVVIVNFVAARSGPETRALRAIAATVATRFPHIRVFPAGREGEFGNNLIVAKREPWELAGGPSPIPVFPAIRAEARLREPLDLEPGGLVLTDDFNPLELWSLPVHEAWRELVIEWVPSDVLLAE